MMPFPYVTDLRRKNLFQELTDLGLTTNLKVCLDSGDAASYGNQTAKWMDLSGNGYDFFRGTTSGADATDPTFNGIVGNREITNYFSSDGGDLFRYDTTNETWMNNLHKNGALSTIILWYYHASGGVVTDGLFGTRDVGVANKVGIGGDVSTGHKFTVSFGVGFSTVGFVSTASVPQDAWTFLAFSHNENGGAGVTFNTINTTFETFNGNVAGASASNAAYTLEIGATGNASRPFLNNGRIAQVAWWEGFALSQASVTNIYNATKGRFGL